MYNYNVNVTVERQLSATWSIQSGYVGNLSRIADRHYIIERGRTVWSGTSAQLIAEPDLQHRYLGI